MVTLEDTRAGDAAWLGRGVVVLTAKRIVLPGCATHPDLECHLPELLLLERLVVGPPLPLATVLEEVASASGADLGALAEFAASLDERGVLRRGGEQEVAQSMHGGDATSAPEHEDLSALSDQALVMPTPVILALGSSGFEQLDHDGNARVCLKASELMAAAQFCQPVTVDEAFAEHQRSAPEPGVLDEPAFRAVAQRLLDAQLLRTFDPNDLSFRRGYDRSAEAYRREHRGRRAVSAAVDRAMARMDRLEADRRAHGEPPRTKVFPVHAASHTWRNPPLSLGLIFAYAKAYEDGRLDEHYDFRPHWMLDKTKIDGYADEPAIYLFSSYVWSTSGNLALSAHAKERNPANLTVHGGPDVPKYEGDVVRYFETNPHVDIVVRGEGEVTTAEMLSALASRTDDEATDLSVLREVPGLSYRAGSEVIRTADRERLADLDVLPSPYLEGWFDPYVEGWGALAGTGATGTDGWAYQLPVVVLETNRGCPYGCTFCDWGSATLSRIRKYSIDRIFEEIDWCSTHQINTIGLADANFGIFERDVEITKRVAEAKLERGFPRQFGTNYAKNTVKHLRQIVEELSRADILSFGLLSLQSMDADTLDTINRSNIKLERYEQLAREFQAAHLPLYVDLMLGLPGQTVSSFRNDLQECIDREVHAKVFPTQLLVNSPMNEPSYRLRHGITARPGELVRESASFTRSDYDEMMRVRRVFFVLEKFSVLRHVSRYVRQETGTREIDFFDQLWEAARTASQRFPVVNFTLNALLEYMVPPSSWRVFLDEVRDYLASIVGIADDDALDTVLRVQHALLPARDRVFPVAVELPHDYVAWHAGMLEAKYSDHLTDWPSRVPGLREFPPGTLAVDDTRSISRYELGHRGEDNPWDAWDLDSPVSRAVALQN